MLLAIKLYIFSSFAVKSRTTVEKKTAKGDELNKKAWSRHLPSTAAIRNVNPTQLNIYGAPLNSLGKLLFWQLGSPFASSLD